VTDDDQLYDFDDDHEPDFTALYEPQVNGDGWQMSPRMAWHLWSAARYLSAEVRTSHPDALADMLPPVARPHVDRTWRKRFVACFDHIADRLADPDGDEVLARCTAEEIALYLTIDLAFDHWLNDTVSPAGVAHLPDHGDQDEAFLWMRDVLFEDHDFLMLFNPALDGVELDRDGDSPLRPSNWFEPFRPSVG
jgi:hypothetical protein